MKRYPKYKDSDVPWLGQVPEHWEVKRCKHYLRERNLRSVDGAETLLSVSEYFGVKPRAEAIDDSEVLVRAKTLVDYKVCQVGDLVMNIMLAWKRAYGVTKYEGIVSPAYAVFRFTGDQVVPAFLHYLLRTDMYADEFKRNSSGVIDSRLRLYPEEFFRVPFLIPPVSEQEAVVRFLDAATAKMDAAISSQERMADLLKERIDSLVLRSISSKEVAHVRLGYATELISRSIEESPSESYTKLGLFNRGRGLFHKDDSNHDEMGDSEFFYVRPGDLIISGQFAWEGAVAMAGDAEDGCVVSHRYPVLRGLDGVVETEYLLAFFCTELGTFLLNEHSRGAAGRNRPLNIRSLLKEKIPLPSIELQIHVVEAIKQRQSILGQIAQLNRLLKERRSAIITKAVTGQIDVR